MFKIYVDFSFCEKNDLNFVSDYYNLSLLFKKNIENSKYRIIYLDENLIYLKEILNEEEIKVCELFLNYFNSLSWKKINCIYIYKENKKEDDIMIFLESKFLFVYFRKSNNFLIFPHIFLCHVSDIFKLTFYLEKRINSFEYDNKNELYYFLDKYNYSIISKNDAVLQIGTKAIISIIPQEIISNLNVKTCPVCHSLFQSTDENEMICQNCSLAFDNDEIILSLTKENEVLWH